MDFSICFFTAGPQIFATTGDKNFQLIIVDFVSTDLDIETELRDSHIPRLAIFSLSCLIPISTWCLLTGLFVVMLSDGNWSLKMKFSLAVRVSRLE